MNQTTSQWYEKQQKPFTAKQRPYTNILIGGLTVLQDKLVATALGSLGYNIIPLPCPDNHAFQLGKEFGNRAQCNPTYFTVGNLVKYLINLRDQQGLTTEEILDKYVFLTVGACGPCRLGMYITEYRKALKDAGFDGFRVLTFSQDPRSFNQSIESQGINLDIKFLKKVISALYIGDVLNLLGYRLRPYEVNAGETDKVIEQCKEILLDAFKNNKKINKACRQCRNLLKKIPVNYNQVKPKISIIGEFWAMTTEGDGNYKLFKYLEENGAECDIQPVANWLEFSTWVKYSDAEKLLYVPGEYNTIKEKLVARVKLFIFKLIRVLIRKQFYKYARLLGLKNYKLCDVESLAATSHKFYNQNIRGGEGTLEVGKVIKFTQSNRSNLIISVKPFGCMPSSGVSDGVQSEIIEKYPDAHFIAIETSGDSAANVYSRIMMALHKAKQKAKQEYKEVNIDNINHTSFTIDDYPKHVVACTAANLFYNN